MPKETDIKRRRTRQDYVFHQTYRTRWIDNDMYAHLNNTIYAQLFDSIINHYLITDCGMDPFSSPPNSPPPSASTTPSENTSNTINKINPSGQVAIMVNSYCDYFASVSYPDVVELGLRVNKLGSTSVTYEVGVFKQGEEDVKVVGGYTHVWCERGVMRPAKGGMERGVREALGRLAVNGEAEVKAKI
ncbi:HotDog domain-containing protein [Aspergillus cavernicola]|uniref:HotDog domain-containing protein n=1 Tax=Aspergillus cavernicola TaxID=176166 RepID=A0ABR4IN69_9EURO